MIYVLLPLSIIIWGIIIVKVITQFTKPYLSNEYIQLDEDDPFADTLPNSYTLNVNYLDPFLKHFVQSRLQENESPKNIRTFSSQNSENNSKQWSTITYGGVIMNKNNKKEVYLITVNSKSFLVRLGEKADLFQLKKAFKDSIIVRLNKENRTITKIKK
jgi:hypothetical protein